MKTQRFEVLSQAEVERIHAASMEILSEVGIKVGYQTAHDVCREADAIVDNETGSVKIPEKLVNYALEQAPTLRMVKGSLGP